MKAPSMNIIKPQSGTAFVLKKGDTLHVIDPKGQQVSDMVLFNRSNVKEKISSGKSLDFEETLLLSKGNFLWSNCANKMMEIMADTNGRNDFLLAPCSPETFTIMYGYKEDHPSCLHNLYANLHRYGIDIEDIPTAFNIFMNVQFSQDGKLSVEPPTSRAGDIVSFKALMDVIVGLTACSAEDSNGGSFKPIHYIIQ